MLSGMSLDSGEDYNSLGLGGTNPELITDLLCTKWDIESVSMATSCNNEVTSYMSFLNPFPCGWILFFKYWQELSRDEITKKTKYITGSEDRTAISLHGQLFDVFQLRDAYFKFWENIDTCISDWTATVKQGVAPSIMDSPLFAGLAFTFTWVHSLYGAYPLCIEKDSNGDPSSLLGSIESSVNAEVGDRLHGDDCTSSQYTTCKNFCAQNGYAVEVLNCWFKCVKDCKPIPNKAVQEKYGFDPADDDYFNAADMEAYYDAYEEGYTYYAASS